MTRSSPLSFVFRQPILGSLLESTAGRTTALVAGEILRDCETQYSAGLA